MLYLCLSGVPDNSEEDLSVAQALNLKWITVLKSNDNGMETLTHSEEVCLQLLEV